MPLGAAAAAAVQEGSAQGKQCSRAVPLGDAAAAVQEGSTQGTSSSSSAGGQCSGEPQLQQCRGAMPLGDAAASAQGRCCSSNAGGQCPGELQHQQCREGSTQGTCSSSIAGGQRPQGTGADSPPQGGFCPLGKEPVSPAGMCQPGQGRQRCGRGGSAPSPARACRWGCSER